jgi:hypothetical protein
MLLSALQAYHTHPEATLAVGNLADQAFQELRQLAIPPTTAPESAIESARTKKPLQKTSTVRAPVRATPRGMSRVASASRILKKQGGGKPGTSGRFSTHGTPLTLADYPTSAKRFSDVLIPTAFDDLKRLARLLGQRAVIAEI